jgi:hypothetical protein
MVLYAYRRQPAVFGDRADSLRCIARYHPETRTLQMLTADGRALLPPNVWYAGESAADFYAWVRQYATIWSVDPTDAFWFDEELAMDEGL